MRGHAQSRRQGGHLALGEVEEGQKPPGAAQAVGPPVPVVLDLDPVLVPQERQVPLQGAAVGVLQPGHQLLPGQEGAAREFLDEVVEPGDADRAEVPGHAHHSLSRKGMPPL